MSNGPSLPVMLNFKIMLISNLAQVRNIANMPKLKIIMLNFELVNPVKILFGKGEIAKIKKQIPNQAKVLLLYGKGSIKKMEFMTKLSPLYQTTLLWNLEESLLIQNIQFL